MSKLILKMMKNIMEMNDRKRLEEQNYKYEGIMVRRDIAYINDGKKEHLLDIYSPQNTLSGTPVVIDIHGGALIYGYKELNLNFNCELAQKGCHVISLNYGLIPQTTLLGQIQDILEAMNYIREYGKKYGLDTEKCCVVGDSAGALLAYYIAGILSSESLREIFHAHNRYPQINALCLVSVMLEPNGSQVFRTVYPYTSSKRELCSVAGRYLCNPLEILTESRFPPTLLISSNEDILKEDTLLLERQLRERKMELRTLMYPEGKEYKLEHVFSVSYPKYRESQEVYEKIYNHFSEAMDKT